MVDYSTFVSVVFEVLRERDVDLTFEAGGEVMQAVGFLWDRDKDSIKAMSRQEAKAHAEAEIEVT